MRYFSESNGRCALLVVALILAVGGCSRGPRYVEIQGIVVLDGEPVPGAALAFSPVTPVPEGEPSTGTTDAQGKFTVKTAHDQAGVLQGKCRVTVWKADMAASAPGEVVPELEKGLPGQRLRFVVPKKYSRFETSGLEFDIQPGMQPLRIELSSQP